MRSQDSKAEFKWKKSETLQTFLYLRKKRKSHGDGMEVEDDQ